MPKFGLVWFFKVSAWMVNLNWTSGRAEAEPQTKLAEPQGWGLNMVRTLQNHLFFFSHKKWWKRVGGAAVRIVHGGGMCRKLSSMKNRTYDIIFDDATHRRSGQAHGNIFCENFLECFDAYWPFLKHFKVIQPLVNKVSSNAFKPTSGALNLELNLPSGARTGLDQTWTLGSVRVFEVWTKVLDQTLASLVCTTRRMNKQC